MEDQLEKAATLERVREKIRKVRDWVFKAKQSIQNSLIALGEHLVNQEFTVDRRCECGKAMTIGTLDVYNFLEKLDDCVDGAYDYAEKECQKSEIIKQNRIQQAKRGSRRKHNKDSIGHIHAPTMLEMLDVGMGRMVPVVPKALPPVKELPKIQRPSQKES